MQQNREQMLEFYFERNVQSFLPMAQIEHVEQGPPKIKEAFLGIIESNPKNELLLSVLCENFRKDMFPNMDLENLKSFMSQVEQDRVDNIDLTHFLNKNSNLFYYSQLSVVELLLSFKFRLRLQDLNAHFVDLESPHPKELFAEILGSFSRDEMEDFLKSLIKEKVSKRTHYDVNNQVLDCRQEDSMRYILRSNSVNNLQNESNFGSKIRETLQSIVLRVVVLGYRSLCQQGSLEGICAVLNESDNIKFNINFWSEKLLVTLLYHYSDFELKSRVTKLLNSRSAIPLVFYEVEENCPPGILINPFFRFILKNQLGIGSFSIGYANNRKIGKTSLLNELFHTRFETNQNDPFNQLGIDVDLGEGFSPERGLAVMDCNFDDFQSFRGMSKMINAVLVSVSFLDLVQNFEKTRKQIKRVGEYLEKKEIFAVILIRDWDQAWNEEVEQPREIRFASREFAESREGASPEALLSELTEYQKFWKEKKKSLKRNKKENSGSESESGKERQEESMASKLRKVDLAKKNFKKIQQEIKGKFISYQTIKNLTNFEKDRRREKVNELKAEVNAILNSIPRENWRFNRDGFEKFVDQHSDVKSSIRGAGMRGHNQDRRKRGQITMEISASNSKVNDLYEELQTLIEFSEENAKMDQKKVFPFNDFWKRKDNLFKQIGKLGLNEREEQAKLERKIDRIERLIKKTKITDRLKQFKSIIIDSKYPIPLLSLFEDYLYAQMKERTNEDSQNASKIEEQTSIFDINLYWRNLKPFLDPERSDLSGEEKKELINLMETLFIKGYGFELIDGDHFIYWGAFLGGFCKNLTQQDQFMTVSVKGPQSSGKSTLMNLQFGTNFKSGSGKCTSGINGYIMRFESDFAAFEQGVKDRKYYDESSLLEDNSEQESEHAVETSHMKNISMIRNVDQNNLDQSVESESKRYILFLDSQGMMSEEQREKEFDRKIGTFLLAVSQIIMVNFMGDLNANFNQLLEVINYSYMKLDLGKRSLFMHDFKRKPGSVKGGEEEAKKPKEFQKILFVSNQNFNLGSDKSVAEQKENIQNSIREIIFNISHTSEKYDASPIMLQKGRVAVEVLGNAFRQEVINRDSDVGEEKDYIRKHIDQKFIRNFRGLRQNSVSQLVQIQHDQTQAERKVWTIGNLSENLGRIWNQIYYNLELYNMSSIKNKIILNDYQEITQKQLTRFIEESKLDHNYLATFSRESLEGAEPPAEGSENFAAYTRFREVFGEDRPRLAEWARESGESGEVDGLMDSAQRCFEEDIQKFGKSIQNRKQTVKKAIMKWLEKKNTDRTQTVRKQMKWDEKKLFETYKKKFEKVEFYEGIHRHNFYFVCWSHAVDAWARESKARVQSTVEKNYLGFKEQNPRNFQDYLKMIPNEVRLLRQSEIQSLEYLFYGESQTNVDRFLLGNMNRIFRGLFSKFKGNESKDFWSQEEWHAKAKESLKSIQTDHFYVDTTLIKRLDYEPEERFTACKYLDFLGRGQVTIDKSVYELPPSKERLVENFVDKLCRKYPEMLTSGNFEELTRLAEDMAEFELVSNMTVNSAKGLEVTSGEGLQKVLIEWDWNMDILDKNFALFLKNKNPEITELIMLSQPKPLEHESGPEAVFETKKLHWTNEHLGRLSLAHLNQSKKKQVKDSDFDYFFEPENCTSLTKIKKVFERVLSLSQLEEELIRRIDEQVGEVLGQEESPRQVLEMSFFQMGRLKQTVVNPILEDLNQEAKLHGASVSYALEETVIILAYQKAKTVLKSRFRALVDEYTLKNMNWEESQMVEFIKNKHIQKDQAKLNRLKYRDYLESLNEKMTSRMQTRFTKFMGSSLKKKKYDFGCKFRLIRKFEEKLLETTAPDEQWKQSVYEYLQSPETVLRREFEKIYTKTIGEVTDDEQTEKFKQKLQIDLNYALNYLSDLKTFLKQNRIKDDIEIKVKKSKKKVSQTEMEKLKNEFKYRLLKNIIEQGKLKLNYSARIKGLIFSIDLKKNEKTKLQFKKEKEIIMPLIQIKFAVEHLNEFVDQLRSFVGNFRDRLDKDSDFQRKYLTLGESKEHKQKMLIEIMGCTRKCPFCNRICEKEHGHSGPHGSDMIGHGIVNVLNSSTKSKPSKSKTSLLKWPELYPMQLKFCDECAKDHEMNVTWKETEVPFSDLMGSPKFSEWAIDAESASQNTESSDRFKKICQIFWKHFGKLHCERNNYMHKESAPAPQIYLFTNTKLIGEIKHEKKNKKRLYLHISNEVNAFNKRLSTVHSKSQISFYSLNFLEKGSLTLLENYHKAIKKSNETRVKVFGKTQKVKNEQPKVHHFDIIISEIKEYLQKKASHRNLFVFAFKDLSKFAFEKLSAESISDFCENPNAYHAVVFSKNKASKRSPQEQALEKLFGSENTTFMPSDKNKLQTETVLMSLSKVLF